MQEAGNSGLNMKFWIIDKQGFSTGVWYFKKKRSEIGFDKETVTFSDLWLYLE